MSVLEVNLAILTASMPIFWPYLASIGTSGIKVMQEVIVRSEPRVDKGWSGGGTSDETNIIARSNSDASDLRLQASNGADSGQSQNPGDGDRYRKYYGDPDVKELVIGDLMSKGGEGVGVSEREWVGGVGGGNAVGTGNQAAAWFEPLQLEELGSGRGRERAESKV